MTGAWSRRSDELADLYERCVGPAVGLARLLTADSHAAEDIAHEAFVRAAGRLGGLREPTAFDAYLHRTVVNLCRARGRRILIERSYLRRFVARESTPEAVPGERDLLWAAVCSLPYRQRAAVVLRYYEDLSEEQTAAVLRCSPRAVNALVSRAMAALRGRLEREEADDV
ncbi:MAG: RNA polymerase sigma factor [Actinomycetota bacterium]